MGITDLQVPTLLPGHKQSASLLWARHFSRCVGVCCRLDRRLGEDAPVGGRSLDLAVLYLQGALLVRPAGHIDYAGSGRQGWRQQPSQQEWPKVIYPQLLVHPLYWWHPNDACAHAHTLSHLRRGVSAGLHTFWCE